MKKGLKLSNNCISALLIVLIGLSSCEKDELEDALEQVNKEKAVKFRNKQIDQDAHEKMENHYLKGIAEFAFHPSGGWVLVTQDGGKYYEDVPNNLLAKLDQYLNAGHEVQCIAFPPKGGDSWVVVTDRKKFARNIPEECNDKLDELISRGEQILDVAFPFKRPNDNSWVIITDKSYYARNIDDECYQMLHNFWQEYEPGKRSRPVYSVAFEPNGGWTIIAQDYFFARKVDDDASEKMSDFVKSKHQISHVAFDPDGDGWSIIANEKYKTRPPDHEIEKFEENVNSNTIWQEMRNKSVPAVSVAVVVDNKLQWSTAYGHVRRGKPHAAHHNTMYQAASISKLVTAVGMHKMVDDGLINFSEDIRSYLSLGIKIRSCIDADSTSVILKDVLNHQSSVMGRGTTRPLDICSGFDSDKGGGYGGYGQNENIPTVEQLIQNNGPSKSPEISLSHKPNTGRSYSGQAFTLLQKLTDDITGSPFSLWMKRNMLKPLDMNDSYFEPNPRDRFMDENNFAYGYKENNNEVDGGYKIYPHYAAAGLYTTAVDLANMIIMLNQDGTFRGNQYLSSSRANDITDNYVGAFNAKGNFNTNNAGYAHGGINTGFHSVMVGFPGSNAGVVVMTNRQRDDISFRRAVAQAVIDAYGW